MPSCIRHHVFSRRIAGVLALAGALVLTGISRGSNANQHGSPASKLRSQGNQELAEGRFQSALESYQKAFVLATDSHDQHERIRDLSNQASVKLALFRYRAALETSQDAVQIAARYGSTEERSLLLANLASLYLVLGDLEPASQAGEESLRLAANSDLHGFKCEVLVCMSVIRERQGDERAALSFLRDAILAADQAGKPGVMAKDWDLLGQEFLTQGNLTAAERAFVEAYRLRICFRDPNVRTSLERLAWLKLEQGDLKSSGSLMDSAFRSSASDAFPAWLRMYLRGRILQAEGNTKEALVYFRKSLLAAREFQEEAAPDGIPGEYAQKRLKQLYSDVVQTSLIQDRTGIQGFEATEEDRAAALRQTLAASSAYLKTAPPEYWATLEQLRRIQAQGLEGQTNETRVAALRSKLSSIEGRAGFSEILTTRAKNIESNKPGDTLRCIQRGLRPEEALLSFHVGGGISALWAVTRDRIELYRLPPEAELSKQITAFRKAVQEREVGRDRLGEALYRELFGGLGPLFREKRTWVISAEDSFFEVPLAALVVERNAGRPLYLVEKHTLLYTPSAAMLSVEPKRPEPGSFVGIGDGIYNTADDRWMRVRGAGFLLPALNSSKPLEMARLAGSAKELSACSRRWDPSSGANLLCGRDATRQALKQALNGHVEVLHIASHFVSMPARPQDTLIYLGLDSHGQPDLVNEKDVASLHAEDATVVMSGCNSGNTKSIAMAGVLGLTRAWLIAGARAVIGARWPTVDDTGDLFADFYQNLYSRRSAPARMRAVAESLRSAQVKMLQTNSWRSDPAYWGAFYVVGKD